MHSLQKHWLSISCVRHDARLCRYEMDRWSWASSWPMASKQPLCIVTSVLTGVHRGVTSPLEPGRSTKEIFPE